MVSHHAIHSSFTLSKTCDVISSHDWSHHTSDTTSYDPMISDTNVTSYSLHPGVVFSFNTRILRSFVYGGELVERLIAALLWPFTKSEVAGAQTSLYLATEERHKLRSGGYYECV